MDKCKHGYALNIHEHKDTIVLQRCLDEICLFQNSLARNQKEILQGNLVRLGQEKHGVVLYNICTCTCTCT